MIFKGTILTSYGECSINPNQPAIILLCRFDNEFANKTWNDHYE